MKAAVGVTLLSGNDVKLELQLLHCGLHKTSRTRSSDLGKTIIMAITVSGMKLESEAFGNQSFPQATSNKNYVTSEFGNLKRVIRHFHSHSRRVSVKESTKAVFNDAAQISNGLLDVRHGRRC